MAGLLGLTRALAVELAPHRIQANAILPGYFDTEMSVGLPAWLRRDLERKTPARRFGRPEALVGAAIFLASAASDFVTGTQLFADGGYSAAERFVPESSCHSLPAPAALSSGFEVGARRDRRR
jgi:NAD(P)-dependent dehydrogenase (short-subunit alcohol dehydrogenase family)